MLRILLILVAITSIHSEILATTAPDKFSFEIARFQVGQINRVNSRVALLAFNAKYVSADDFGNNNLLAKSINIGTWQSFDLINIRENIYALRALVNGKFVTVQNNEMLIASKDTPSTPSQQFELIEKGRANWVSFKSLANGKFVGVDQGEVIYLIADRQQAGNQQTFIVKTLSLLDGMVVLKAANDKYVKDVDRGSKQLIVDGVKTDNGILFQLNSVDNLYTLRSFTSGKYVAVKKDQFHLIANSDTVSTWQSFSLNERGHNAYNFNCWANGLYVAAESGGGRHLVANREVALGWEEYRVGNVERLDTLFAIKAANDKYVAVGNALMATGQVLEYEDYFYLINMGGNIYAMRSYINGKLVSVQDNQILAAVAHKPSTSELFQLIEKGKNKVNLKSLKNGRYVSAKNGGGTYLIAQNRNADAWEEFTIVPRRRSWGIKVAIRSNVNGKYVSSSGELIANKDSIGPEEEFTLLSREANQYFLKSVSKDKNVVVQYESKTLEATASGTTSSGLFEVIELGMDKVNIKLKSSGLFVSASSGGNDKLMANKQTAGLEEEFTIINL